MIDFLPYVGIGVQAVAFIVFHTKNNEKTNNHSIAISEMKIEIKDFKDKYPAILEKCKKELYEKVESNRIENKETAKRLHEKVEKIDCVKKIDCDRITTNYETRLISTNQEVCQLIHKISDKLSDLEIKIEILIAEKNK